MPDIGWICMLHPVIANPLSLQLCYFHYKHLLFTTTLFPAELSSGRGFSSCAISLLVCVGTVPHQSLFGGTTRFSVLLPTRQGLCAACHLCHQHCPQAGRVCPTCSPLTVAMARELCPAQSPGRWVDLRCESKPRCFVHNKEGKRRAAWAAHVAPSEPWQQL